MLTATLHALVLSWEGAKPLHNASSKGPAIAVADEAMLDDSSSRGAALPVICGVVNCNCTAGGQHGARVPFDQRSTVAMVARLSRTGCRAAVAEEAVPLEHQLGGQLDEDAGQSGSRQALLSTSQGIERLAGAEGMQPLTKEQPWKGIDSDESACRALRTPAA